VERQLDVPSSATVNQVCGMIIGDNDAADYQLAIGGADIEAGVPLSQTPVIPAYNYATSLLQVIGNGRLEPDKTAEALNSLNGVVRSLSNGITDVDGLCAAASRSMDEALQTPRGQPTAGHSNSALFQDLFQPSSTGLDSGLANGWSDAPSPAVLVRKLSQKMPDHFVPDVSEDFVRNSMRGKDCDVEAFEQLTSGRAASSASANPGIPQPSLQEIAKVRRHHNAKKNGTLENMGMDMDIAAQSAAAAASGFGNKSAVMASNGQSTWVDNVATTWSLSLVRSSGALEKTPDGKELKLHLDEIDNAKDDDDEEMMSDEGDTKIAAAALAAAPPPAAVKPGNMGGVPYANRVEPSGAPVPMGVGTGPSSVDGSSSWQSTASRGTASGETQSVTPRLRRATPIAPSPTSGGDMASVLPAIRPPPIKRGRKVKNPDLTPFQRKQLRKEQKRRSARDARIRKKTMEEGYQTKLKLLIGENGDLKKQVNDLTHRLQVLQGLLTVTVRPIGGGMAHQRHGQPQLMRNMNNMNGMNTMNNMNGVGVGVGNRMASGFPGPGMNMNGMQNMNGQMRNGFGGNEVHQGGPPPMMGMMPNGNGQPPLTRSRRTYMPNGGRG